MKLFVQRFTFGPARDRISDVKELIEGDRIIEVLEHKLAADGTWVITALVEQA